MMNKITYDGYRLIEESYIDYLEVVAYYFEHKDTGLKVVYFNKEINYNFFSISFKTLPWDNSGIFHILEHLVFRGSKEKYPFSNMMQEMSFMTLLNYINGTTFRDKTSFYAESNFDDELEKILGVYLNLLFNPFFYEHPEILNEERGQIYYDKKNQSYSYKGIVYNEIVSLYNNLLFYIESKIFNTSFSGSPYGFDYFGNQSEIQNVSNFSLINTHKKYYNPSNCCLFFYGNLNFSKYLNLLNDFFEKFNFNLNKIELPKLQLKNKGINYLKTQYIPKKIVATNIFIKNLENIVPDHSKLFINFYKQIIFNNPYTRKTNFQVSDCIPETFLNFIYLDLKDDFTSYDDIRNVLISNIKKIEIKNGDIEYIRNKYLLEKRLQYSSRTYLKKVSNDCLSGLYYHNDPFKYLLLANENTSFINIFHELKNSLIASTYSNVLVFEQERTEEKPKHLKSLPSGKEASPICKSKYIANSTKYENSEGKIQSVVDKLFDFKTVYIDNLKYILRKPTNGITTINIFFEISGYSLLRELTVFISYFNTHLENIINSEKYIVYAKLSIDLFTESNQDLQKKLKLSFTVSNDHVKNFEKIMTKIMSLKFSKKHMRGNFLQIKNMILDQILKWPHKYLNYRVNSQLSVFGQVNEVINGISLLEYITNFEKDESSHAIDFYRIIQEVFNIQNGTVEYIGDERYITEIASAIKNLFRSNNVVLENKNDILELCVFDKKKENFRNKRFVNEDFSLGINLFDICGVNKNVFEFLPLILRHEILWKKIRLEGYSYSVYSELLEDGSLVCGTIGNKDFLTVYDTLKKGNFDIFKTFCEADYKVSQYKCAVYNKMFNGKLKYEDFPVKSIFLGISKEQVMNKLLAIERITLKDLFGVDNIVDSLLASESVCYASKDTIVFESYKYKI